MIVTVNLSTSKNSGAIQLAMCCLAASAKRCFCKMGETEAGKKRMPIIRDQKSRVFLGLAESNRWLRNKCTHTFDVSMYNTALAIHVKVMQPTCYSKDLDGRLRWVTNASHSYGVPTDRDQHQSFHITKGISPGSRWGHYGRSTIKGSCDPK